MTPRSSRKAFADTPALEVFDDLSVDPAAPRFYQTVLARDSACSSHAVPTAGNMPWETVCTAAVARPRCRCSTTAVYGSTSTATGSRP